MDIKTKAKREGVWQGWSQGDSVIPKARHLQQFSIIVKYLFIIIIRRQNIAHPTFPKLVFIFAKVQYLHACTVFQMPLVPYLVYFSPLPYKYHLWKATLYLQKQKPGPSGRVSLFG